MFSLIGATPEQVARLRDEFAIYIVGDSRLNIAGLREERMDEIAEAFAAVGI
jgi:aspartate/tyrosine/aromatic aminotransferase